MKMNTDAWLAEHLKMWKESGIPAPLNELQSIAAWLRASGSMSKEELQKAMRARMLLLMNASQELHAEGREMEDLVGIYDNRPDLRPDDE
jgi:hypothetical protein